MSPRRRGVVLVSLALACGGLAASHVQALERDVEARVGAEVPVVVTAGNVPAGRGSAPECPAPRPGAGPLRAARRAGLGGRGGGPEVGHRAPARHLRYGQRLRDARAERSPGALRRGERAVEVGVAGGGALAGAPPGSRVDVLVSSEPAGSAGAYGGARSSPWSCSGARRGG